MTTDDPAIENVEKLAAEYVDLDYEVVYSVYASADYDLTLTRSMLADLAVDAIVINAAEEAAAVEEYDSIISRPGSFCTSDSSLSLSSSSSLSSRLASKELYYKYDMACVQACFPNVDVKEIEKIYVKYEEVEQTIEELLSIQLIASEFSDVELAPDGSLSLRGKANKRARQRQNKKKSLATTSIEFPKDVQQTQERKWGDGLPHADTFIEELAEISKLIGMPLSKLLNEHHKHDNEVIALISCLDLCEYAVQVPADVQAKSKSLFKDLPDGLRMRLLRATKGNLQAANLLVIKLYDKAAACNKSLADIYNHHVASSSTLGFVQVNSKSKSKHGANSNDVWYDRNYGDGNDDQLAKMTAAELHAQSRLHFSRYVEYSQKAHQAHRRANGENNFKAVGAVYIGTARQSLEKAKNCQLEGARRSAKLIQRDDMYVTDLHYLSTRDARTVVQERLDDWWVMCGDKNRPVPLKIITGAGRHSVAGKASIRPAVLNLLNSQGWRHDVFDGWIIVRGR
ncbi:hypothetical protein V1514DRAFT_334679 [Lipomyces japonicus]|uniref:uncharacterized protein n=1 Tax=Lipomyces japonicus TaxID=56871 RepID=UPI0034CD6E46